MFTAADRAEACVLPAETGVPLSRWSCPDLARELAARRQIPASPSTIGRWLACQVPVAGRGRRASGQVT